MQTSSKTPMLPLPLPEPTITLFTDHAAIPGPHHEDVHVTLTPTGALSIQADTTPLRFLRLHWDHPFDPTSTVLGDAWERSYGDLQWRTLDPSRWLPWYFLLQHHDSLEAFGVATQPAAFALWSADPTGPTLWLDLRSGSRPLTLHGRTLPLCTLHTSSFPLTPSTTPFDAACAFCHSLSPAPLPIPHPIYGSNNWYYAYGQSSRAAILTDSATIHSLTHGLPNRPYMVVDDGWDTRAGSGPHASRWSTGNPRFGSMQALADDIRSHDLRPGIWFRPLETLDPTLPDSWMLHHDGPSRILDPSLPQTLELIQRDIQRLTSWGYQLLKHDFTTYDTFRLWGFQMNPWPTGPHVPFADTTRTSAEIILSLYRTILHAASPHALVLGCNTFSHLAAGLVHINRIGDDTSGRNWERTRRMGINTLAFRLPQHNHFYQIDADCVGIRGDIPYDLNLQWATLLAHSSTPFFASIRPGLLTPTQQDTFHHLFALASTQTTPIQPLDTHSTTPSTWQTPTQTFHFSWHDPAANTPDFTL